MNPETAFISRKTAEMSHEKLYYQFIEKDQIVVVDFGLFTSSDHRIYTDTV